MKKALKIIKNIVIGILGVIFFTFAIIMSLLLLNYNDYGITEFGDISLIIIKDKVATNEYNKGDLVVVEYQDVTDIKVGDSLFAYRVNDKNKNLVTIDLGKIQSVYEQDDSVMFENGTRFSSKFLAGKAIRVYPKVGNYLSIIQSKWGFMFLIIIPCFIVFIYEIYALIIEIKYGKEDEGDFLKEEKNKKIKDKPEIEEKEIVEEEKNDEITSPKKVVRKKKITSLKENDTKKEKVKK